MVYTFAWNEQDCGVTLRPATTVWLCLCRIPQFSFDSKLSSEREFRKKYFFLSF